MIKFSEAVKIENMSCKSCISLLYTLPCRLDKDIVKYMTNIGTLAYPVGSIRLLKIISNDGFKIEGKLEKNTIKLEIPNTFSNTDINKIDKKIEFDTKLAEWISDKLDMDIILE